MDQMTFVTDTLVTRALPLSGALYGFINDINGNNLSQVSALLRHPTLYTAMLGYGSKPLRTHHPYQYSLSQLHPHWSADASRNQDRSSAVSWGRRARDEEVRVVGIVGKIPLNLPDVSLADDRIIHPSSRYQARACSH